jgi:hypothetical protein
VGRAAASPPGSCPRGGGSPRTGLTLPPIWSRRRQARALSFVPAVPPTCHKQRSPAVSSGQSRSLGQGRCAGRTPLTWGGGGARNCMACKGSGVQIPSAPPQVNGPLRGRPPPNRPPRAANRQQLGLRDRSSVRLGSPPASIAGVDPPPLAAPGGRDEGPDRPARQDRSQTGELTSS